MGKKKATFSRSKSPIIGPRLPQVYVVRPDDHLKVVVLSSEVDGYDTHWDGKRTIPCIKPHTACRGHICKMPQRWAGFLHCWEYRWKKDFFLALTPQGEKMLKEQLQLDNLRGSIWTVTRERKDKRAPLLFLKTGQVDPGQKLKEEIDPHETVMRMWGIDLQNSGG